MYESLLPSLADEKVLVLTATQRLSKYLMKLFCQYQLNQSRKVWETPTILPLNTWLMQVGQLYENDFILSSHQETFIWQKIINKIAQEKLLSLYQTIRLVQTAWQNLTLWNIPLAQLYSHQTAEIKIFTQWAEQFENLLKENNWRSEAQLPAKIMHLFAKHSIELPHRVIVLGYDEIPPAINALFLEMGKKVSVTFFEPSPTTSEIKRFQFKDQRSEIKAMTKWAKNKWLNASNKENIRIGCIIPNLSHLYETIITEFTATLTPENQLAERYHPRLPLNISSGQALSTFPLIKNVLELLSLNDIHIELNKMNRILLAPYLNHSDEDKALASRLDILLRQEHQFILNRDKILVHAFQLQENYPQASLPLRLKNFFAAIPPASLQTAQQWVEYIHQLTQAMGWPYLNWLNSLEFQLLKRWNELLLEVINLDPTDSAISYPTFLQQLNLLCQEIPFQPESEDKPIQVLGLLEASGLAFDALWIMGLDNETWPGNPNPNPFLPIHLQRQWRMPHASSSRELEYSEKLQWRLFGAAAHIIISSAEYAGEKALQPSRLICNIVASLFDEDKTLPFSTLQLEEIQDTLAPPIHPTEVIRGGSWILQQQSLCPFRAFAYIRLKAEKVPSPEWGLTAAEKGTLIHRVLEFFWKKVSSQAELKKLTTEQIEKIIVTCIDNALLHQVAPDIILQVERKRLLKLILQWLDFEKKRPPFKVLARETKRYIPIGKLNLSVKIDRIDELENKKQLIIDYKTGAQLSIQDWLNERPKQPQLPLYCLSANTFAGIAYAQLTTGKMTYKGIIDDAENSFQQVIPIAALPLKQWSVTLTQLSDDFCQGKAHIDPLDEQTCLHCDLHAFCRI